MFWDRHIPVGRTWDEIVEAEVERAKCVVVLWSRASVASAWVRAEAEEGATRGVLVPVMLEETKLPIRFRAIQAAHLPDLQTAHTATDFNNLFEAIQRVAGAPRPGSASRSPSAREARRAHELEPMPTVSSSIPPSRSPAASTPTNARRADAPSPAVTAKPTEVDAPHRGDAMAKILIVEDDEMNRDMLSRRLMRRGYDVTIAVDGVEGVRLANERHPDLILMDMSLPEMDGWQAIRELKAADVTATIPVIALTAHAMADDRRRAIEAGCNDFDTKPVELTRLLGKIEALLAKK